MKKIIIISFCILTVASVTFFGCKKGPDDPFISFRSRKARVSGVWNVSAYTKNGVDSATNITTDSMVAQSCGTRKDVTTVSDAYTWTFEKTGDYNISTTTTTSFNRSYSLQKSGCVDSSNTIPAKAPFVKKGIWDFGGGVGAFKSKEQLILTDATDHVNAHVYELIKCSEKELILQQSITDTTGGYTKVNIYEWTLDRQK